jgi:hypothetical protein
MPWIDVDGSPVHINTGRGRKARPLTDADRESLAEFVRHVHAMIGSDVATKTRGGKHRAAPVSERDC